MPASEHYRRQVGLLIRVLPLVAEEQVFALKGGTAINLFIRDLPRLSVDIDLTYLPVAGRPESLADIDAAMQRIAERARAGLPGTRVHEAILVNDGAVNKVFVRDGDVQVKIEVTPVIRGCVYDPTRRTVTARVEAEFGFAETQLVSFADLYAGKLVAALDRQHPRDLFDVKGLLADEGIVGNMPRAHKDLLMSFEAGRPDWSLIDVPQAAELPAVRWRQENLNKLDHHRREALLDGLRAALP